MIGLLIIGHCPLQISSFEKFMTNIICIKFTTKPQSRILIDVFQDFFKRHNLIIEINTTYHINLMHLLSEKAACIVIANKLLFKKSVIREYILFKCSIHTCIVYTSYTLNASSHCVHFINTQCILVLYS